MCVCVCVSLCLCVCVSLSLCLCVCVSVCVDRAGESAGGSGSGSGGVSSAGRGDPTAALQQGRIQVRCCKLPSCTWALHMTHTVHALGETFMH